MAQTTCLNNILSLLLTFPLGLLYLTTVKLSGSLINFGSLFMHVALGNFNRFYITIISKIVTKIYAG